MFKVKINYKFKCRSQINAELLQTAALFPEDVASVFWKVNLCWGWRNHQTKKKYRECYLYQIIFITPDSSEDNCAELPIKLGASYKWLARLVCYLRRLVEAWQPADIGWSFFGAAAAAERQQRPLADQQHVADMQVDVLLLLFLVVVQGPVLKALGAHRHSNYGFTATNKNSLESKIYLYENSCFFFFLVVLSGSNEENLCQRLQLLVRLAALHVRWLPVIPPGRATAAQLAHHRCSWTRVWAEVAATSGEAETWGTKGGAHSQSAHWSTNWWIVSANLDATINHLINWFNANPKRDDGWLSDSLTTCSMSNNKLISS